MYEGKDLSVIIAAYNEGKNILGTIKRVKKTVPKAEIIVVDDGSKDGTAKIAKSASSKDSIQAQQGKGLCYKSRS